jgi:hypothetical protein
MAAPAHLKPFAKGKSGNPGGRPKVPVEVKQLARDCTPDAIKTLASIMRSKKSPAAARVMAANSIIDRGYGKPTQHIEAHVDLIDRLSLTEQEAFAEALATLAAIESDVAEGTEETHH